MNEPFVSIIIPARNAQSTIKKCLDSIFELNYNHYEVIVINDGSSDSTGKTLAEYPNIKVLTASGVGPSKARNLALEQTTGEFIAFTDADCIVENNWLTELLKGFGDGKIVGVGGTQKSPADDSWFGKRVQDFLCAFGFISDYIKSGPAVKPANHNPSCNVMYRKSVLLELEGFLENLWPGEDVEIDYRIKKKGYALAFNPQARVSHYRPATAGAFNRMMFRYGKAQGWLVKRYGIFRVIHLVPILFLILLCLFPFNRFLVFLLIFLGVIFLAIKLFLNSKDPFFVFWLFICAALNWNIGFFSGLFKKKLLETPERKTP